MNQTELALQLQQAGIVDQTTAGQLQRRASPWWLQILLAIAAWIASLLIIGSFIGPVLALADHNAVRAVIALLLISAAIWLAVKPLEFLQQMSVAVALAGQGMGLNKAIRPARDVLEDLVSGAETALARATVFAKPRKEIQ